MVFVHRTRALVWLPSEPVNTTVMLHFAKSRRHLLFLLGTGQACLYGYSERMLTGRAHYSCGLGSQSVSLYGAQQ